MCEASAILYLGMRCGLGVLSDMTPFVCALREAGDGVIGSFGTPLVATSSPFVHSLACGEGVSLIDATRSSEDLLVCVNRECCSTVLFAMPRPSILATAASSNRSSLCGSVDTVDGTLKSSLVTALLPPKAPLTAVVAAFRVIGGCGIRPSTFKRLPALAHCQIPLGGDVYSGIAFSSLPLSLDVMLAW